MSKRIEPGRPAVPTRALGALAVAVGLALFPGLPARADDPPVMAIGSSATDGRIPIERPGRTADRTGVAPQSSSGWWIGTVGIGLALAAFGGLSLASRGKLLARSDGPLRVVGRLSLTPKHAIFLVQAGERTLIIGTGTQGPPALLDEWTGPPPGASRPPAPGPTTPVGSGGVRP